MLYIKYDLYLNIYLVRYNSQYYCKSLDKDNYWCHENIYIFLLSDTSALRHMFIYKAVLLSNCQND